VSAHDTAPGAFRTTRWTLFQDRDLESIARLYWKPVYLHIRRKGIALEDARDLTQDFFARFLERDYAAQADPSRGRFRSFLRAAVDHFCADAGDRARALKRGSGRVIALDVAAAEPLLSTAETPERAFDRQWARSILDDAVRELEAEYAARGRAESFAAFKPVLAGGTCADRPGLHRARARFRELVRGRVARTVESPSEVDDELRSLLESL
jgi:RNA polymerase sigma-70 factor (ECF subfamily)